MAASYQTAIEVAAPPPQVEGAVFHAFTAAGLTGVRGGGGTMHGRVALNLWTWGETLSATIGFGPRGATVMVRSECAMPIQLFDWGKNRKNVERVIAALRTMVPVL